MLRGNTASRVASMASAEAERGPPSNRATSPSDSGERSVANTICSPDSESTNTFTVPSAIT